MLSGHAFIAGSADLGYKAGMRRKVRITLMALLIAAGPSIMAGGAGDALAGHRGAGPGVQAPGWRDRMIVPYGGRGAFRAWSPRQDVQLRNQRNKPNRGRGRGRRKGRSEQDRARDAVRRGQALPLAQIIGGLQNRCPGAFLGAQLIRTRQGLAYQVRILRPSGRRITLLVDAGSGAVVRGRCN